MDIPKFINQDNNYLVVDSIQQDEIVLESKKYNSVSNIEHNMLVTSLKKTSKECSIYMPNSAYVALNTIDRFDDRTTDNFYIPDDKDFRVSKIEFDIPNLTFKMGDYQTVYDKNAEKGDYYDIVEFFNLDTNARDVIQEFFTTHKTTLTEINAIMYFREKLKERTGSDVVVINNTVIHLLLSIVSGGKIQLIIFDLKNKTVRVINDFVVLENDVKIISSSMCYEEDFYTSYLLINYQYKDSNNKIVVETRRVNVTIDKDILTNDETVNYILLDDKIQQTFDTVNPSCILHSSFYNDELHRLVHRLLDKSKNRGYK